MFTKSQKEESKAPRKPWQRRLIFYGIALLGAIVYIFVLSDSNYNRHHKLNNKIEEYEAEIAKQQKNLDNQCSYKNLQKDPKLKERYRREVLNMKKNDEDVFIIK